MRTCACTRARTRHSREVLHMQRERGRGSEGGRETCNACSNAIVCAQPLPGGYRVRDAVFWAGEACTFPDGFELKSGTRGHVRGLATHVDYNVAHSVKVRFDGNEKSIDCPLSQLRREEAAAGGASMPRPQVTAACILQRPL